MMPYGGMSAIIIIIITIIVVVVVVGGGDDAIRDCTVYQCKYTAPTWLQSLITIDYNFAVVW